MSVNVRSGPLMSVLPPVNALSALDAGVIEHGEMDFGRQAAVALRRFWGGGWSDGVQAARICPLMSVLVR